MGVGMLNFVRVISIAVAMSLTALGSAAEDSPKTSVVDYLRVIVAGDQDLADALSRNIALAGESGDGHQYWRGKTLADLYPFFEEWLHNPLKPVSNRIGIIDGEIVRHDYLFWDLLNADQTLRIHNEFMGWMALFMNARQQFFLSSASAKYLTQWYEDPRVRIGDYVVPPGGFRSFNDFFLRRLKPGARPVSGRDDPTTVVSPVDCEVYQVYNVKPDQGIAVKQARLSFSDLLDSDPVAETFEGGEAFTCNLKLTNYHHFHSPVTGRIAKIGQVGGIYYFDNGFRHLYEHRRAYVVFDTEALGRVILVAVGQVMVNSIKLIVAEGDNVEKGQELGHFDFGGSEIVMLFQPGKAQLGANVKPGHMFWLGQELATPAK